MDDGFLVFVVDDDILMLEMVVDLLRDDCKVEAFISAQECLQRLHQQKPDMFLLDISMPDVDGYDLCRILKDKRDTSDIPVTFVSANDSAEARLLGYEAGGEDFITKPFAPDELQLKVQVARRITANKRALAAQAGAAKQNVMAVKSGISELTEVAHFLTRAISCQNPQEIGQALLDVLHRYDLDGAVQLRVWGESISLSPNGRDLPLEVSVLNNVRTAGRVFQFKSRCVFNYEHLTLMVNNMPLADAERCGRIRDNGALLAEGAEARLLAIESNPLAAAQRKSAGNDALPRLQAALAELQASTQQDNGRLNTLMIEYQEQLAMCLGGLGLTEAQEADLIEMANDYMRRMLATQEGNPAAIAKLVALASSAKA